jgi:molybdopterin molybdotransferase
MASISTSRLLITPEDARRITRAELAVLPAIPTPLDALLGRILAEQIAAGEDLPGFANSAMDGYAIIAADAASAPVSLRIVGEVASGQVREQPLQRGEAVRIMTGAPVPAGADAVIRVEDTSEAGSVVEMRAIGRTGDNIRPAGEDFRRGDAALDPGMVLTPARVGALAALGRTSALAIRPARVAILATGNELVEPDAPLVAGKVRNSNAPALFAQVLEAGAVPVPLGVAPDDFERTVERVEAALDLADVLVTSGGVSMGRYDHVGKAFGKLGEVLFTAVAQMPGKPLTFARIFGKPVFGLPGNPVSTVINFELYVRPVLRLLMGHEAADRPRMRLPLGEAIEVPADKDLYARVVVSNGKLWLTGPQGSGLWQSLARADGLAILKAGSGEVPAGTDVDFLSLG